MVQLRGLYLRRKILTENFDSYGEHCFYIKLNTAIIMLVLYALGRVQKVEDRIFSGQHMFKKYFCAGNVDKRRLSKKSWLLLFLLY